MLSDCVNWLRGRSGGYGMTELDGKPIRAHRAAWIAAHGPIPAGMVVHHRCRNRLCTNVEHLELLTASEHGALHGAETRKLTCPRCGGPRTLRPERRTYRCLACHARAARARRRATTRPVEVT